MKMLKTSISCGSNISVLDLNLTLDIDSDPCFESDFYPSTFLPFFDFHCLASNNVRRITNFEAAAG